MTASQQIAEMRTASLRASKAAERCQSLLKTLDRSEMPPPLAGIFSDLEGLQSATVWFHRSNRSTRQGGLLSCVS